MKKNQKSPKGFVASISEDGTVEFVLCGQPLAPNDAARKLRKLKGWTRRDLAFHIGVGIDIVKRWENCRAPIPSTVMRLMMYLLRDEESHPRHTEVSELL